MPDRKIDAIGKADAMTWNTRQLPKGTPNTLRILSGVLSQMNTGQVMHAMVQKAAHGAFKISLNGQGFLVKGLPASLIGKEVSFIAQQSGTPPHATTELLWLGVRQTGEKKQAHTQQPQTSLPKYTNILSALPTGIKAGQTITANIDAIQGKQMTLSLLLPHAKNAAKGMRHQLLATSLNGMQQDQQITAKVILSNNKPMLEIIPQQHTAQSLAKADKPTTANFKLATGETTAAVVQKRLANGHVQLNIRGTIVEAPAPATVKKGDVLMLRMHQPPAGFQLLAVHKYAAAKALASLKSNLPVNQQPMAHNITAIRNVLPTAAAGTLPPIQALTQLESALKATELTPRQTLNGTRMAQIIRHSGADLEAKLQYVSQHPSATASLQHDLKSIMLQLANQQPGNPQHIVQMEQIKALAELGRQGVARIETGQALNILAHMQGEPIRLELPMLVNQQMVNVQLSIQQQNAYESDHSDQSDANDATNTSYNILFALELSQLGKIRVDANISDNAVHARIYNDNPDSNQFILDNIQRLESRLQSLGFQEVYLLTSHQQPEADKQQRFDQLTQMTPASLSLLDIRV